nr:hypothetical protein [Tanacetum cinerariifolium]
MIFECRREGKKQAVGPPKEIEPQEKVNLTKQVLANLAYPEQLVVIGKSLSPEGFTQLKNLLKKNKDIFAWKPLDMTGVLKRIIKHSLNANPSVTLVSQKRMVFCFEKSQAITREVAEWLKAWIVRPVKYPTWISNLILVKKVDRSSWMCIDFKNINAACPKDYYPLPEIDSKMEEEDEKKTAFYTYQGTYCYTKMPFGLKNTGATNKRLVDEAFHSQIENNLEVYVDAIVVKNKSEKEMLANIAETFDNLRRINMKLNPKKSLHFFETLKDITKENKNDYRWMEKAENAFQELKKMILDPPVLTTPLLKETLYIYLAASGEAVSVVLLVVRKRKQYPVHYINQSSKSDTSRKLAWYSIELGAYNITYDPCSAIKGQILANFINEVPVGSETMVPRHAPYTVNHQKDYKEESIASQLCHTRDTHGGMQDASESKWGMDVLGPLPEAPRKVRFIIVAVDYFTKWIEAKMLAKTTENEVNKFTWDNIVCRYGLQKTVVTDNETNFIHDPFKSWSLMKGIKTRLWRERKDWVDKLPNVLWAHRTSLKTSNGETPNSLTFGSDAVISAKIGMPTHRTMMIKEGNEEEIRLNLDLLQERREAVAIREARYKMKIEHYYNKSVRPMSFKAGGYVYQKIKASRVENLEKIGPKWEGPYLVVEAYQNGSYKLRTMDDNEVPRVWHEINMRRCHL